jgi:hypothetical protein
MRIPEEETPAVEVPAIVSQGLWKRARDRRAQSEHAPRRKIKHDFLLRRRVTCGECHSSMRTDSVKRKHGVNLYYRCHRKFDQAKGGDRTCSMGPTFARMR